MGLTANKEVLTLALCNLQMNCFSLGQPMWEHARLICFILDAHRSAVPTKLLHSTSDRATGLHNALALYRPRQKLPFYYLVRRSSQRSVRLCMSVVSAILRCHVSVLAFAPAELANTISQPTLSMVTNAGTLYSIATLTDHEHH